MNKFFHALTVLTLGVGLFFGTFVSASGASVLDSAVTTLESGRSYAEDGDTSSVQGFDGTEVGVALLALDNTSTFTPAQAAQRLYDALGEQYQAIVVVNTGDGSQAYGVAPGSASQKVLPLLSGSRGGEALGAQREAILQEFQEASAPPQENSGIFVLRHFAFFLLIPLLLILVVVFIGLFFVYKARQNKDKAPVIHHSKVIEKLSNEEFKKQLKALEDTFKLQKVTPVRMTLSNVLNHTQELFKRLSSKGNNTQLNLAALEYTDIFRKLSEALGENYYLDIYSHPELWDKPKERLQEVEAALRAVDNQLVENIREVNSRGDLNFRVSLESLIHSEVNPPEDMLK